MSDLQARRAEAEAELAALQRERGAALLDNRTFSRNDRLKALQNRLGGFDVAEGIQADRARDAAETQRLARVAELRSELAGHVEDRFDAYELAQMAARNFVDAVNTVLRGDDQVRKTAKQIDPKCSIGPMGKEEVVRRLAGRLAGLMTTIRPRSALVTEHRFGHIELGMVAAYKPADDWTEKERKAVMPHLEPVIAGALPKPKTDFLKIADQRKTEHVFTIDGTGKA